VKTFEHGWIFRTLVIAALAGAAMPTWAQGSARERDEDPGEAYRRGYEDGFARGYRKGLEEGEQRAAEVAPPPPPPRSTGPITISRAVYGTGSRLCDATRWTANRANGRRTASLDVSNKICGDPSPGERKSLEVTYVCGTIAKTASANEHRSVTLDCTP
jgi:hypothetical protein